MKVEETGHHIKRRDVDCEGVDRSIGHRGRGYMEEATTTRDTMKCDNRQTAVLESYHESMDESLDKSFTDTGNVRDNTDGRDDRNNGNAGWVGCSDGRRLQKIEPACGSGRYIQFQSMRRWCRGLFVGCIRLRIWIDAR